MSLFDFYVPIIHNIFQSFSCLLLEHFTAVVTLFVLSLSLGFCNTLHSLFTSYLSKNSPQFFLQTHPPLLHYHMLRFLKISPLKVILTKMVSWELQGHVPLHKEQINFKTYLESRLCELQKLIKHYSNQTNNEEKVC